jgi:intraflagellar transport protein 140
MDQKLKTSNLFFFGGKSGIVCLADDSNHCSDVCKVGGAIKSLLFYEKENSVIIITSTMLLVQFRISTSEKSGPDKKVKLSIAGDADRLRSIWIGHCLLATCSFENMLRLWHLEEDENYVLTLLEMGNDEGAQHLIGDKLTCVAYERRGRVLVAGTQKGNLVFWKNQAVGNESPSDSESWKALPYIPFEAQVHQLSIGENNGVIAIHFGG